ncbi:hypothetical protein [Psychrobacter lutiphocae]|uniref:hypothetical protein n=1 Tax=Psychrobacter lutiphocae TaxID=540500 RepID=UPI00036E3CA9|nr:hypothetical protein [Psychrobacter lutiphocae]
MLPPFSLFLGGDNYPDIGGSDNVVTGASNYGKKQSDQVPSAALDAIRVDKNTAGKAKLVVGLSTGVAGSGNLLLKPKFVGNTTNKAGTVSKAEVKVAKIENNVNAENPSFGSAVVREFTATPNHQVVHRAENINAGQVTDRDGLQRVDNIKWISDNQVAENLGLQSGRQLDRWGTQRPAWKNGTLVTDHVLTEPRKFQMVIDQRQLEQMKEAARNNENPAVNLGGWATDTPVTTVSDVRNKLAVPEEWKSGNLYVVELTAKPGTKVREGTVGDMWSTETELRLPGGGHQVEFKDHPATSPENFEVDLESLDKAKTLK